jgi:replication factor A1
MIKMPYEEMISKIIEKSSLSKEVINDKINEKLKQLSGLISKEGAAHIVANELGIVLFEKTSGKLKIKDILPGMRNLEVLGKLTNIYDVRTFTREGREGKVASLFIRDENEGIRVVCWGSMAEKTQQLNKGDIIAIKGGYSKENNGQKEIHLNDRSAMVINPPGEKIELPAFQETKNQRKSIKELNVNDSNIELLGFVVQIFDPRFYEICPECQKRIRIENGVYTCPVHGEVNPDYSYVLNLVLDDGTDTIQSVFFRNQVESLIQKNNQDMLIYKDAPQMFSEVKNMLLGTQIKVEGKVNNNQMFDRKEFVVMSVNPKPDPKEELDLLKKNDKTDSNNQNQKKNSDDNNSDQMFIEEEQF